MCFVNSKPRSSEFNEKIFNIANMCTNVNVILIATVSEIAITVVATTAPWIMNRDTNVEKLKTIEKLQM